MNIHPSRAAVAKNLTIPFQGVGGTGPYSYRLLKGKGSINAVTGIFTSPPGMGTSVIEVKDINGNTAEAEVLTGNAMQLFCDILQHELGLDDGRVYLWDQKINKPKDEGLFIAVAEISCKPISNIRKMQDDGSTFQSTNFYSKIDVNIISRGTDARDRRAEVLMALNSFYSENQQALNSFRVFPLTSSFVNLSEGDGSAIPYRYVLSCAIAFAESKVVDTPYYNTFDAVSVTTDNSGKTPSAND